MKAAKLFPAGILGIFLFAAPFAASGCATGNGAGGEPHKDNALDTFAKCITAQGGKMYGASWCPHCQSQKEMFGESWKFIDYNECAVPNSRAQTAVCSEAGITAYPAWDFKDGKREMGKMSFQQLSEITGCKIPPAMG